MRNIRYLIAGFSLVAASAVAGTDTDLLPNGDFSTTNQTAGWGGVWVNDDANKVSGSGAMEVTTTIDTFGMALDSGDSTSTCFGVRPNAAYRYGGQSRMLPGPLGGGLLFYCSFYSVAGCTGNATLLSAPAMSQSTTWNATPAIATGVLPANAVSVNCSAGVSIFYPTAASAHFDNLFFTTDVIFANGFEFD